MSKNTLVRKPIVSRNRCSSSASSKVNGQNQTTFRKWRPFLRVRKPLEKPQMVVPPIPESEERSSSSDLSAIELYIRDIRRFPLLTSKEERKLVMRVRKGDRKARNKLTQGNLRLVISIAKRYRGFGLPFLDLISEGNCGLIDAVERFRLNKGARLSTYASIRISQYITRALARQSKVISLPVHIANILFRMNLTEARLQEELGRQPTNEELACELNVSLKRVLDLRTASMAPISLSTPVGEDGERDLFDVVEDFGAVNPATESSVGSDFERLEELIFGLDDKEAKILRLRFGLDGNDEHSLEELGDKFGVSRERIRQIQEVALTKLRRRFNRNRTL